MHSLLLSTVPGSAARRSGCCSSRTTWQSRSLRCCLAPRASFEIGDPFDYATDVGPVIDEEAKRALEAHKKRMRKEARELLELSLGPEHARGSYVAPAIYEIPSIAVLAREVFGPILHVVRYAGDRLGDVCDAINATGYGLTLSIHSRVKATADFSPSGYASAISM